MGGLERVQCVERCRECAATCEETASLCLESHGLLGGRELMRALVTTAAVARYLGDLLAAETELAGPAVQFVVETCEHCVDALARAGDGEQLRRCADACAACADCAHLMAALAEQT